MFLFVLMVLVFSYMGANSKPHHLSLCKELSCEQTIAKILSYSEKMKKWRTQVINETEHDFMKCNLEIFKNELKNHSKNVNCAEYVHKDKNECVVDKSLECIPIVCKVPHMACTASKTWKSRNLADKLKSFLQKLRKIQEEH